MFIKLNRKRGQSTLEYAIVIGVVVGALLAMQYYMNRGLQGRLRSSADQIGNQYSAGNVTSKYTSTYEQQQARDRFGGDELGKGVSRYDITDPGYVTKQTKNAGDEEKINKTLDQETLY